MAVDPTLEVERGLFEAGWGTIVGCDEVGRGAIAGPVAVGAAVLRRAALDEPIPEGLRDSKAITERRRPDVAARATAWVAAAKVAMVPNTVVDERGILFALGEAGVRALEGALEGVPGPVRWPVAVVLDGTLDWLTPRLEDTELAPRLARGELRVLTRAKADRDCAVVAAASVLAKVRRDAYMVDEYARFPEYGWDHNKGYGSAAHRAAIAESGPCELHRLSWLK